MHFRILCQGLDAGKDHLEAENPVTDHFGGLQIECISIHLFLFSHPLNLVSVLKFNRLRLGLKVLVLNTKYNNFFKSDMMYMLY